MAPNHNSSSTYMYILICKGNVSVPLKSSGYKTYYTGDILRDVPDLEAEQLLSAYGSSFYPHRRYDSPENVKPAVVEPSEETKVVAELQVDSVLQADSDDEVVILPLEDDAHHSTVKSYLLDLEESNPPPLAKVRAVKAKFPQYKSVVAECDRILSAYSKDS